MKELLTGSGGRRLYNEDLNNLQDLALSSAEILKSIGKDVIITGCKFSYVNNADSRTVSMTSGYVYLDGKIRIVSAKQLTLTSGYTGPFYICPETASGPIIPYISGTAKAEYTEYKANLSTTKPTGEGAKYIQIFNFNDEKCRINTGILGLGLNGKLLLEDLRDDDDENDYVADIKAEEIEMRNDGGADDDNTLTLKRTGVSVEGEGYSGKLGSKKIEFTDDDSMNTSHLTRDELKITESEFNNAISIKVPYGGAKPYMNMVDGDYSVRMDPDTIKFNDGDEYKGDYSTRGISLKAPNKNDDSKTDEAAFNIDKIELSRGGGNKIKIENKDNGVPTLSMNDGDYSSVLKTQGISFKDGDLSSSFGATGLAVTNKEDGDDYNAIYSSKSIKLEKKSDNSSISLKFDEDEPFIRIDLLGSDNCRILSDRIAFDINDRKNLQIRFMDLYELINSNKKTEQYYLSISANNKMMGSAEGSGVYVKGSNVILKATANTGYKFSHWIIGGSQVTTNPYTYTITGNTNVVANFVVDQAELVTPTSSTSKIATFDLSQPTTLSPSVQNADSKLTVSIVDKTFTNNGVKLSFEYLGDASETSNTVIAPYLYYSDSNTIWGSIHRFGKVHIKAPAGHNIKTIKFLTYMGLFLDECSPTGKTYGAEWANSLKGSIDHSCALWTASSNSVSDVYFYNYSRSETTLSYIQVEFAADAE